MFHPDMANIPLETVIKAHTIGLFKSKWEPYYVGFWPKRVFTRERLGDENSAPKKWVRKQWVERFLVRDWLESETYYIYRLPNINE